MIPTERTLLTWLEMLEENGINVHRESHGSKEWSFEVHEEVAQWDWSKDSEEQHLCLSRSKTGVLLNRRMASWWGCKVSLAIPESFLSELECRVYGVGGVQSCR